MRRIVGFRMVDHPAVNGEAVLVDGRRVATAPGVDVVREPIPIFGPSLEADLITMRAVAVLRDRPLFAAAWSRSMFRAHVAWLRLARELRLALPPRRFVALLVGVTVAAALLEALFRAL